MDMERREIALPPTEWAKLDAYVAILQERHPGIDASGVLTRMVRHYPWVSEFPERTHGVTHGMERFLRKLEAVQTPSGPVNGE
jgi:hypothetical protein